MKIHNNSSVRQTQGTKKAGSAKGGFGQALRNEVGKSDTSETSGVSSASVVNPLLSVQEVPDAAEERKRAVQHGHSILDELEELRMGLLFGSIPLWQLEKLEGLVKRHRENLDDPRLLEILDEIEVRAAVELAKLGR